ncbi:MAG: hypothetical protein CL677_03170 [Bdellovibrionaceae bacterium]|nr:hypothetical protein [Pseudobdellovibrionaceae bacterium]|tara:strand:- start:256464 stop:257027 length:564 start_codon:yes stop_codon:yes gene_type:complete
MFLKLLLSLSFAISVHATEWNLNDIQQFETDMCTSSPEGHWGYCCYEHDIYHWIGGQFAKRLEADQKLRECMNKVGGPGHVYYEWVRVGGIEGWGFAWPDNNRNQNITEEGFAAIDAEKDLWESIGRPPSFNFVVTENIIYNSVSEEMIDLLKQKFEPIKNSQFHKEQVRKYEEATGETPFFVDLLH